MPRVRARVQGKTETQKADLKKKKEKADKKRKEENKDEKDSTKYKKAKKIAIELDDEIILSDVLSGMGKLYYVFGKFKKSISDRSPGLYHSTRHHVTIFKK